MQMQSKEVDNSAMFKLMNSLRFSGISIVTEYCQTTIRIVICYITITNWIFVIVYVN